MKKIFLMLMFLLVLSGCSVVRIDTSNIDNILNVILTKDNKLYNQLGQGYKYYLPGGVTYIDSDELNDILYCNGDYYYLYIDAVGYYNKLKNNYEEKNNIYYSKLISTSDGFKSSGYLEIVKEDNLYYIDFLYNNAKIETVVTEKKLNNAVLNATYILSTVKYNNDILKLILEDEYFTNKTGKYDDYNTKEISEKFVLEKETMIKER